MTLLFHDPISKRYISHTRATAIAFESADWQGIDPAEMRAIFSRLATDEEARETFEDITGLEAFNR